MSIFSIIKLTFSRLIVETIYNIVNAIFAFILQIWLLHYVLESYLSADMTAVMRVLFLILVFRVIMEIVNAYYFCFYVPMSENNIRSKFQKKIFWKISMLDLKVYDTQETFNKIHRAIFESNSRIINVINLYGRLVYLCTYSLLIFIYVFSSNLIIVLVAILPAIINAFLGQIQNKENYKKNIDMTNEERKNSYFKRIIYISRYAKELRTSNVLIPIKRKYNESICRLNMIREAYAKKNIVIETMIKGVNQLIIYFGAVMYIGYKTIVQKMLTIDESIVMIQSIWQINNNFSQIIGLVINLNEQWLYVNMVNDLYNIKPEINIKNANNLDINFFTKDIAIRDVHFNYHDNGQKVLNNINLKINKGQKIAIVGYNGSGKTTLVKLILRLYDVEKGAIELDNINIKNISYDKYRKLLGTELQDFRIFATTIRNNIFVDKVDYSNADRIIEVCRLKELLLRANKGLDTNVTKEFDDDGINFSGGEEQRIALARAYAKETDIIVLDEPTSALDPIAESEFLEDLYKVCDGKTVVMISHRLSSVIKCDLICFMESGKIIEQGSHKELMELNGKYAQLFKIQAQNYLS